MSGGSQNSKQTSTPWKGQQPYLTDLFNQAQGLYQSGQGQDYYPGPTVAPFSPQSQMAMQLATQEALNKNPVIPAMENYLAGSMNQGQINPYSVYAPASQAASGIGPGQSLMYQAGQGNPMVGGAAGALGGMTGYGGLGEASMYAGSPVLGTLPASAGYVQDTLAQSPSYGDFADEIASRIPGVSPMSIDGNYGASDAARSQLAATSQGGFLGSNPYLDQMFDTASGRAGEAFREETMPAIAAQFGSAGRTGSGIHQEIAENAARQFGRDLQGMAADIYAPSYEAERGRQLQAAGQLGGLDIQGQGLGLQEGQSNQQTDLQGQLASLQAQMQGLGLSGDLYGGEQQRRLGAAGLGGDLFSQYNQADLGRLGLGSDLYLGERGLGQSAASDLGQLGLGFGNLQMGAGQGLGQLGLGGTGQLNDLYGNIDQSRFRAGSLAPSFGDYQYSDLNRLMGVGGTVEDQTQRLMDANRARFDYERDAPWNTLNNYASIIYGLPGGYGSTSMDAGSGSRLNSALGGAMAGYGALGPWGALGGAVLGGLL